MRVDPFTCAFQKRPIYRHRKQLCGCQGLGSGSGEGSPEQQEGILGVMEMFDILILVVVAMLLVHCQNSSHRAFKKGEFYLM